MAVVEQTIIASSKHSQFTATAVQDMIRTAKSLVIDLEQTLDILFQLVHGTFESKTRLAGSHSSLSSLPTSECSRLICFNYGRLPEA